MRLAARKRSMSTLAHECDIALHLIPRADFGSRADAFPPSERAAGPAIVAALS